MAAIEDVSIRRRDDGSIDTAFYVRRARHIRRREIRHATGWLKAACRAWLAAFSPRADDRARLLENGERAQRLV